MQAIKTKPVHTKFNINRFNFAIPLMAFAGLSAIGIFAINQDIDETASASNVSPISSTISYEDEYITISNSAQINIGTADVVADGDTYIYTTDNVTVSTNVSTGYDLYISSNNSESAALTNPDYYTEIAATSGTGSDTGTPKVLDANSYGYAVPNTLATNSNFDADYSNPSSSSKWAGVPVGHSDRLRSTHTANEAGDVTDVHYGAYVTNYLAEGTYTNEVVYSAVATPTHETVQMKVSPNNGLAGGGTTLTITSGPTNISTTHELSTSEVEVYFRQNNNTKGTCTITNIKVDENGVTTTCTTPALSRGYYDVVVSLPRYGFMDVVSSGYAIYTLADITNMQDSRIANACTNTSNITSLSNLYTYEFKDTRNSQKYYIRKFSDGKCWMVENLYLTGGTPLDSSTTNITWSYTLPSSSTNFSVSPAMYDGDRKRNGGTYDGSYYNYCAAKGLSSCGGTTTSTNTDICPKYWRLPSTNESSSIVTAVNNIDFKLLFANSDGSIRSSSILPGYYTGSTLSEGGTGAYYINNYLRYYSGKNYVSVWGSTTTAARTWNFGVENKNYGFNIRCLVNN